MEPAELYEKYERPYLRPDAAWIIVERRVTILRGPRQLSASKQTNVLLSSWRPAKVDFSQAWFREKHLPKQHTALRTVDFGNQNALPDENTTESQYGDELARTGIQSEAHDGDPRSRTAPSSNPRIV